MRFVKITSYMNADQAEALAQFFKRIGFSEFKQLAVSMDEAYLMQEGALKVADALADNGFAPRRLTYMSSIFETKVESETLTSDELASITGCTRRHDQVAWLKNNGWVYHLKRNGEPVVGRLYARLKLAGVNPASFAPAAPWVPDFSKLS